jgi:hypothetical protein
MSTEAVGAIWIGGAALNTALIWTSVGLTRLMRQSSETEDAAEFETVEAAQPERVT